jgi:hypothetical protein
MSLNRWKQLLYSLTILLATFSSTVAIAYQFGPPPITELAESGGTQSRVSIYSQNAAYDGSSFATTLQGISYAATDGDSTGGKSVMVRLAKYSDNRTSTSGTTSDGTGMLAGVGIGGQWYFGSARNFGLILDGQLDYLEFNYDVTLTNNAIATLNNSQLAIGVEVGATYRIFVGTATITPFVTAMQGSRKRSITTKTACTNCAQDYTYTDSATTLGIDFMMGKFSASALQTNASYDSSSNNVTYPSQKTTITMFMVGYNF